MRETILVTAIGSFSASAVIGSLKKDDYRVIGCDIYPAEWVVNSRDVDGFYKAPFATDRDAYRDFVKTVCEKEQVSFVMPLTDVEIDVFRTWENMETELQAVVCMSSPETLELCRDKKRQEIFLNTKSVCETIPGRLLSEIIEESEGNGFTDLTYPLILKLVDGRSSQGLRIANSPKEMAFAVEYCREKAEQYLVQPKITGPVITVDVVRDAGTGNAVCVARRELLRTANGAGTSVYVFKNACLEKKCRDIAEAFNIRGCVNLEFVEEKAPEEKDGPGIWRFLECNPRFSGGLAFSVMAGYDMVKNHLNCFTGRNLEPADDIREQYIARRYTEYIMD